MAARQLQFVHDLILIHQYKGHLSNISENTLMTAVNDEGGQINVAVERDGSQDTIPKTMQKYKARNEPWMLVVDDNCTLPLLFTVPTPIIPLYLPVHRCSYD